MRSIEFVLFIDFFRRGAILIPLIPLMLLVMIGVPMWVFLAVGRGALDPTSREAIVLHVSLTLTLGFLAAVAVLQAVGPIARFFTLPISAARLASCQLLLGMITIGTMYLIAASVFNLSGADWPLIGPAAFLATSLACTLAAVWWFDGNTFGQFIAILATNAPLIVWFNRCYGATVIGDWNAMWHNSTAAEMLTLGAISAAAYGLAIVGVQRVRRGDRWDFSSWRMWLERLRTGETSTAPRFRTPFAALAWSEWRQKFGVAPAIGIGCFVLLMVAQYAAGFVEVEGLLELICAMPLVLLSFVIPLVFGLALGDGSQANRRQMRHLLATRPVPDSLIAAVVLRNCGMVLLSAWLTWIVLVVTIGGIAYWSGHEAAVRSVMLPEINSFRQAIATMMLAPVLSWTVISLTAMLAATGRQWLWACVFGTLFGLVIVFAFAKQYVPPALFDWLTYGWLLCSGAAYIGATFFAFYLAIRKRLLTIPIALATIAAWISVSLAVPMSVGPQHQASIIIWQAVGCLSLAILPIAGLPLAIRWNRHR